MSSSRRLRSHGGVSWALAAFLCSGCFNAELVFIDLGTSNSVNPNAPLAMADVATVDQDGSVVIPVLENDIDPKASPLSLVAVNPPARGLAADNGDGTIGYFPEAGFFGLDHFSYEIANGEGLRAVGWVKVRVMSPFTWTGVSGDGLWSTGSNWHGGSPPGSGSLAVFDPTCEASCSSMIDVNINVQGIFINAFPGSLTQGASATITVGSLGWHQRGGIFRGSSGTLLFQGGDNAPAFVLESGADFRSSSGTLYIGRNKPCCNSNFQEVVVRISGATFDANGGTTHFLMGENNNNGTGQDFFIMDLEQDWLLDHAIVEVYDASFDTPAVLRAGPSGRVRVAGDLEHRDGRLEGDWHVAGDFTVLAGADGSIGRFGLGEIVGAGSVILDGAGNQAYVSAAGGRTARLVVDKPSGTVLPAAGTVDLEVSFFELRSGIFSAPPGTLRVGFGSACCDYASNEGFRVIGGSFEANGGTVLIHSTQDWTGSGVATVIDVPGGVDFHRLVLRAVDNDSRGNGFADPRILVQTGGQSARVWDEFVFSGGVLAGDPVDVLGNVYLECVDPTTCAYGGTSGLRFVGTANQSFLNVGGSEPGGDWLIDKPSGGAVFLGSNLNLNAAGQSLTITSGSVLNLQGFILNVPSLNNFGTINP